MRLILIAALLSLGACSEPPAPAGFTVRPESLAVVDSARHYTARVVYPQIEGRGLGLALANLSMADTARAVVALYRPPEPPPPELADRFEASVEGGFETALLADELYSGLLEAYAYTGGAHGTHDLRALNVDLRTGRPLTLAEFFAPDAAWRDTLAERSTSQLERSLGPDVLFDGHVPTTEATFRVFTLTADSLVVTFPPYVVAPYAAGPQRVAFAWSSLAPMLRSDGPARFFAPAPTP